MIYTPRRCPPRRVLLTVSKWRRVGLTLLGAACIALPFAAAVVGNISGIK